jgi:hypothetical protein
MEAGRRKRFDWCGREFRFVGNCAGLMFAKEKRFQRRDAECAEKKQRKTEKTEKDGAAEKPWGSGNPGYTCEIIFESLI